MTQADSSIGPYEDPSGSGGRGISISPTRKRIEARNPHPGFFIQTGGLPYFEVLLATDPVLFDPANASQRTSTNFYASRQDSGLLRATDTSEVYLVPPAILRSFLSSTPPPRQIYFSLVCYPAADGRNPVFAHPIDSLASRAPAIEIAGDLTSSTFATVLGVPVDKLRRFAPATANPKSRSARITSGSITMGTGSVEIEDGYALLNPTLPAGSVPAGSLEDSDPSTADLAPQDGYEVNRLAAAPSSPPAPRNQAPSSSPGGNGSTPASSSASYAQSYPGGSRHPSNGNSGGNGRPAAVLDYEDGYEAYGTIPSLESLGAYTQESAYPPGSAEPLPLEDEDEPYPEEESDVGFAYNAPQASAEASYDKGWAADDEQLSYGEAFQPPVETTGEQADFSAYEDEALGFSLSTASDTSEPSALLTIEAKRRIIEQVSRDVQGKPLYNAVNLNTEFSALKNDAGLAYGIAQFDQDSGQLGRLLSMMNERDPGAFGQIFGPQAGELLRVTNAPGPSSQEAPGVPCPRMQPVAGAILQKDPGWLDRFNQAAAHPPFIAAQNELAASLYLDPMLAFAAWLGLNTDRALAILLDRAIRRGIGDAQRWIMDSIGPVQAPAQRQQALAALGFTDLTSFQAATPGLQADGHWGHLTHAALVGALRRLGASSPIPIPSRDQMLDGLVARSAGQPWEQRLTWLRSNAELSDTPYQI
jgi:hypothetical protein